MLLAGLGGVGAIGVSAGILGAYYYVAPELPAAETIREIPLQIPLRIFSRDGHLIDEIGDRRRVLISYDELPEHVVNAFVAAEDKRFWVHPGIDYQGILRAFYLLAKTGEISGGGSTLTQQLARDYFLTRAPDFTRKLREAFLAYKIEQEFDKQEIMALFLNKMFFGQRAYGVAAAAQAYFGKNLQDINEAEAATLAGVLPAPSNYNPVSSAENAEIRRGYVLGRMRSLGYIDDETYERSMAYPMLSRLHATATDLLAPYVGEMVRREMIDRYGEEATYSNGFKVITTLDSQLQRSANYALRNGLLEFTRRRGYRGPIAQATVPPETLQQPYADWPEELRLTLANYNPPGSLAIAIVTETNDETRTANIVLQDGEPQVLPWHGISWAKPFIDPETTGDAPELVSDVLTPGDVIYVMKITLGGYALAQLPRAQSAVVSLDPEDGAITSLVGGFDFTLSKFNRVTQAARQPGSSFKPFTYAAALHAGNTLATIIEDAPVVINSSALERLWRPINYSGRFYGEVRVREALVRSMNLASVRLLLYNTTIGATVRYLEPFGFNDAALPRNGSLALGGGNATPLDMAQGYATFANGGFAVKPYVIDSISDADGNVLYRANPSVVCKECEITDKAPTSVRTADRPAAFNGLEAMRAASEEQAAETAPEALPDGDQPIAEEILEEDLELADLFPGIGNTALSSEQLAALAESYRPDANTAPQLFSDINSATRIIEDREAFLIQDAMRSVIWRGTGIRARRALGRTGLSGKTGTSNDGRDAWFAGFNSKIVAMVWVGYDDYTPLGPREEGSRTALPIWNVFMADAVKGMPLSEMEVPDGMVRVRIAEETGCPPTSLNVPFNSLTWEYFREEYVPECDNAATGPDIFNEFEDDPPPPDPFADEETGEAELTLENEEEDETEDEDTIF